MGELLGKVTTIGAVPGRIVREACSLLAPRGNAVATTGVEAAKAHTAEGSSVVCGAFYWS